jgi:holo-[acyl-carrier protein] synthase
MFQGVAPLIGIDLIEPARLRERMQRTPELVEELFHPGECAYCESQAAPEVHLAARFCAKEAVAKALGLDGFDPRDVEVLDGADRCGVRLHGKTARRAAELGVVVTISLTHLAGVAAAVALALPTELLTPPSR